MKNYLLAALMAASAVAHATDGGPLAVGYWRGGLDRLCGPEDRERIGRRGQGGRSGTNR